MTETAGQVGSTLRRRLYSFLRPKCHGVLLDTRINSVATVRLNVYQAFLLAAIKFHCYTRALPQVCDAAPGQSTFVTRTIN